MDVGVAGQDKDGGGRKKQALIVIEKVCQMFDFSQYHYAIIFLYIVGVLISAGVRRA